MRKSDFLSENTFPAVLLCACWIEQQARVASIDRLNLLEDNDLAGLQSRQASFSSFLESQRQRSVLPRSRNNYDGASNRTQTRGRSYLLEELRWQSKHLRRSQPMAQVTARRRQRVARSGKAAGETRVEAVVSMKVRASVSTLKFEHPSNRI